MTLSEYRNYVQNLEQQIFDALEPIIDAIRIPEEVELSDIDIPILDLQTVGDKYKRYRLGMVQVSSSFTFFRNKEYRWTGEDLK